MECGRRPPSSKMRNRGSNTGRLHKWSRPRYTVRQSAWSSVTRVWKISNKRSLSTMNISNSSVRSSIRIRKRRKRRRLRTPKHTAWKAASLGAWKVTLTRAKALTLLWNLSVCQLIRSSRKQQMALQRVRSNLEAPIIWSNVLTVIASNLEARQSSQKRDLSRWTS